jgi:hypothetical protein
MKKFTKKANKTLCAVFFLFLLIGGAGVGEASASTNKSTYWENEPILYNYSGYQYKQLAVRNLAHTFYCFYEAGPTENFANTELQTICGKEFPIDDYDYILTGVEGGGYPRIELETGAFNVIPLVVVPKITATTTLFSIMTIVITTTASNAVHIFQVYWGYILSYIIIVGMIFVWRKFVSNITK